VSPVNNQAVSLLFLVGLFAVMYLLFIRPQTKRRKEMQEMQQSLDIGTHVLTVGGLYGTVVDAEGDAVLLEVAPDVSIWYSKGAVGKLVEEDKMPGLELVPEDEVPEEAVAADEPADKPTDKLTKRAADPTADTTMGTGKDNAGKDNAGKATEKATEKAAGKKSAGTDSAERAKDGTDGGTRTSGSKGPG
jgi:preprotein translocase subunit YajC